MREQRHRQEKGEGRNFGDYLNTESSEMRRKREADKASVFAEELGDLDAERPCKRDQRSDDLSSQLILFN